MRPINLLPPEAFQQLKARRRRARLGVVGVLYVALLVLLMLLWQGRVDTAQAHLRNQQAQNEGLQDRVAALVDVQQLLDDYDSDASLITEALLVDVSWGRLLNDLARLIPDRVWLESFVGSVDPGTEGLVGSLSVSAVGFEVPDVSAWLRSLDDDLFPGVSGAWVHTVTQSLIGEFGVVSFSSTTGLTPESTSSRAPERIPEVAP